MQGFFKLCLDPDILQLCILNGADIINDPVENKIRQFRKVVNHSGQAWLFGKG